MGGKSSKTTQENKPPAWAEPLFKTSASEAMNLYKSGAGGNTYLGSTVAPLSDTTMQGVNQLAQAGQAWDTAGTRPLYQQLGAASVDDPFVNQLNSVAQKTTDTTGITGGQTDTSGIVARDVSADDFRGILDRAQAPTSAAANLQSYASGANLNGEGNPFYRQRLETELDDTAAQLRSLHSGMGRSGSDFSVRQLTESLADQRIRALENDWNREQQNQFNAVGMIDAANQAGLASQLGAASGIAGINTGNADRSLSAGVAQAGFSADDLLRNLQAATSRAGFQAGDLDRQGNLLSNAGALRGSGLDRAMGATNAMAGLDQQNFENQLAGAGATLQAGGLLDEQAQKQIQDEVAKFYALDNEDWTRLGMLQAAAAGSAGPYGTQIATTRQPFNPLSAIAPLSRGK